MKEPIPACGESNTEADAVNAGDIAESAWQELAAHDGTPETSTEADAAEKADAAAVADVAEEANENAAVEPPGETAQNDTSAEQAATSPIAPAGERAAGSRATSMKDTKGMKGFSKNRFLRMFLIVLAIAVVIGTTGLTLLDKFFLDEQFMSKDPVGSSEVVEEERPLTSEDIHILIPGSGIFATEFADSKRVNILLLGDTDEHLSDTIILASFDPETKSMATVSVPRDTYYPREGYSDASGHNKINAVFADKGARGSAEAIHDLLGGVPINYYAVCDYDGVANIIDAMGGVPFNVPIPMYYSSPGQNLLIDLKAGEQVLDGDHAVQYLRFRSGYVNGDIGRVQAQQEFVKAAVKQAVGIKLPAVAKAVVENVDSDITPRTILYLVQEATGMNMGDVQTYMLDGRGSTLGGLSYWVPKDAAEIEQMMREIYDPQPAEEESGADTNANGAGVGTSESSTGGTNNTNNTGAA